MTDKRPDDTAPGADEPLLRNPLEQEYRPEEQIPPDERRADPDVEALSDAERDALDADASLSAAERDALDEAIDTDEPPLADDPAPLPAADEPVEEADDGRRRPPLAVIIVSVLLLGAIGAGLAFLLPSGPVREADQLVPTAAAATGEPAAGATVPTALPLPEATGEYSSTEVIAQVGEGAVTRGDFVRQYQPGQDPAELLNQLIQIELVVQEAAREGVTADATTVDEQVAQIKASQAGGDDAQFAAFLDQAKVGDEANLRRLLERDSVLEQMILRHTTIEQVRARHILLASEATTDTAKLDELRSEAEGLMEELDGGADFAAIAAERSDDPGSKESGGDLGWAPRGLYVGPFDEAVFSMEAGERRLVETQFGFHIIEVLDAPAVRPLESTDLLQTQPGQQAFADTFLPWIEELQQTAESGNQITIVVPAEQLVSQAAAP